MESLFRVDVWTLWQLWTTLWRGQRKLEKFLQPLKRFCEYQSTSLVIPESFQWNIGLQ